MKKAFIVDLDRDNHIIGLEILGASKRLTPGELTNMYYENLLLATEAP